MPQHIPYYRPSQLSAQPAAQNQNVAGEGAYKPITDPWDIGSTDETKQEESWLLNYVDILTIFLILLVVILALQPKELFKVETDQPEPTQTIIQAVESELTIDQVAMAPDPGLEIDNTDGAESASASLEMEDDKQQLDVSAKPDSPSTSVTASNSPGFNAAEQHSDQIKVLISDLELDKSITVTTGTKNIQLEMSDSILFPPGSAVLKDDTIHFLDELATLFQKQQGIISIEGHTDNQPIANDRFPSNWELSAGRASRVTRYLINHGVTPERIQTVGYADTRPKASNDTEEGRRQNRRVSLVIYLPDVAEQKMDYEAIAGNELLN